MRTLLIETALPAGGSEIQLLLGSRRKSISDTRRCKDEHWRYKIVYSRVLINQETTKIFRAPEEGNAANKNIVRHQRV
ncbi:unnamed protein product [Nesidiocoris tenuis]|uniref:Uncharacterized protein n=1 Tax=Nesidiocoris tenuis TaxID=355587 RepID=A0A6H5HHH1_9HEMI|nr:unnamed protein product [Nesidiocoris tenuis]